MSPPCVADGSDSIRVFRELVPGMAGGFVERFVIGVGPIREMMALEIEPGQLHRIQFGGIRRQRDQGDVGRHAQGLAAMPAGVVEHQHDVYVCRDSAADLGEVQIHAGGVAGRHDPADRLASGRTGGAEEIDPFVLGLTQAARACAARGPDMGQRALLPEAALVLEPDFETLARVSLLDFIERLRELFLYAACAAGSDLVCRGRGVM